MEILVTTQNEDIANIRALYEKTFSDSKAFVDYYFQEKLIPEKVMAIKEDSKIIAMLHLNPFIVKYNNWYYDVSYIVAVATDMNYRKRGYMGSLMEAALNRMYLEEEAFCLLMPIDSRIYERFGFAFVEDHLKFDINSATLTVESSDYTCWTLTDKDIPKLVQLFERYSKQLNLSTIRDAKEFTRLYHELLTDSGEIIVFEEGYMMTYFENHVFHVREFVCNSNKAFNEMLSYVKDKTCMGRAVIADHSRSLIKYVTPNIPENTIKLVPFMMARIINVKVFLAKNYFIFKNNIKIKVVDPNIENNNRIFHVNNGQVFEIIDELYDLELDIHQLTQLTFGYIQASEIGVADFIETDINSLHFFNEFV